MTKYFLIIILISLLSSLQAQEDGATYVSRDLSSWSSATFKWRISKPWSISLSEQVRLKTNSSELDAFFTELNTKYKFDNGLYVEGAYRFINDRTDNLGLKDLEQRFHGDIGYAWKYKKFRFDARLRGQSRDDIGENKTEDGDYTRRALRLKLETKYDIKKWKLDPVFSMEIFRENGKYVSASFSKWRTTIGTEYSLEKAGDIGVFYRYEKDLNTSYPLNNYIIGFNYKFTFKSFTKDAK